MNYKRGNFYRNSLPAGCKKTHVTRNRKMISPEDKAKITMEYDLVGRITFKQYDLLIKYGYAGEVIMKWSKYKAFQVIEKEIAKGATVMLKICPGFR